MATEKKSDTQNSVENTLKSLYQLQNYLSEIDRIKILRGELPFEVKDLEDEIVRYETRLAKLKEEINDLKNDVNNRTADTEERRQKIARYEEQMDNVRNNREFSFLEKEKEFETLEIQLNDKKIREATDLMAKKQQEISATNATLEDHRQMLEEKRKELEEIISETRVEEENLRLKAQELEPKIEPRILSSFKRIRKNARNGLGIVTVQRNACGGCFNRIPPQRQLDIKTHKAVIVCEYCGRIMMDGALAGIEEPKAEAPAPKKRTSRAKKIEVGD
ncbi:MAG: hypothetical protein HDR95_00665 [Bacteroides sp.]|nr:hypothetical protein [Bacteroidales bacterium]MBD5284332.1 hypothetical protein [Bacteroides sp.]MBD5335811.1 hypothetical protein [Bacteroides sp.]